MPSTSASRPLQRPSPCRPTLECSRTATTSRTPSRSTCSASIRRHSRALPRRGRALPSRPRRRLLGVGIQWFLSIFGRYTAPKVSADRCPRHPIQISKGFAVNGLKPLDLLKAGGLNTSSATARGAGGPREVIVRTPGRVSRRLPGCGGRRRMTIGWPNAHNWWRRSGSRPASRGHGQAAELAAIKMRKAELESLASLRRTSSQRMPPPSPPCSSTRMGMCAGWRPIPASSGRRPSHCTPPPSLPSSRTRSCPCAK